MPERSRFDDAPMLRSLRGRRVLVVEDDYLLAQDLREGLENQGAEVLGPLGSVAEALELLQQELAPDTAVLDVNLQGERVYPVADALRERGIPFIFATGYDSCVFPEAYADVPRAEKPIDVEMLITKLLE